jgi:hypothetical protein
MLSAVPRESFRCGAAGASFKQVQSAQTAQAEPLPHTGHLASVSFAPALSSHSNGVMPDLPFVSIGSPLKKGNLGFLLARREFEVYRNFRFAVVSLGNSDPADRVVAPADIIGWLCACRLES